ncbi:tRNA methyltransferase 10 homolog A [Drosophila kikkawai]|uniref:tRNA (guanine(9)-N(1))-methyltransferase n=1 Tax=Drosophila kikkawai TaxID=30033 RepID=A0A6P4ILI1_DROKI|nr:tRNA methyltransferase 10 homolog A [Drosophila kikkawai]
METAVNAEVPVPASPAVLSLSNCPGTTPGQPQSKNQLKKQRKLAEYTELRKLRRERERERKKQKRREAKELGLPIRTGPSRKELKKRQVITADSALSVAIDLDYDDLMQERDIAKCVKQCLRIYTINRRSPHPGKLHFTGIRSNGHIHESFRKNDGWENWHVAYHFDRTHLQVFESQQLVYLTCESDQVLDKLQPGITYVIGGLVDHNHWKGLCHQRATEAGLTTARLPLSEHVDMKTRSVLSTYHVFELLSKVAAGQDWTKAILDTIPLRKGAKAKATNGKEAEDDQEVEEELESVEEKLEQLEKQEEQVEVKEQLEKQEEQLEKKEEEEQVDTKTHQRKDRESLTLS